MCPTVDRPKRAARNIGNMGRPVELIEETPYRWHIPRRSVS